MNNLNNIFSLLKAAYLLKMGFLFVDLLFIFFLIILVKQVFSMNQIINDTNDSAFVKSGAIFLLIIAVSLFLVALVIL